MNLNDEYDQQILCSYYSPDEFNEASFQSSKKCSQHYSVVVTIMKLYCRDRDSNPDRCGENQTC